MAVIAPEVRAASLDPTLRKSERLDIQRLGKVSEDERSVLRIEWRAGQAQAAEAETVQDMLDRLQRLDVSINRITRLIVNMPARTSSRAGAGATAAPAVAVQNEAPEPSSRSSRLLFANIAAATLVALWWFRRRKSSASPAADANAIASNPSGSAKAGATPAAVASFTPAMVAAIPTKTISDKPAPDNLANAAPNLDQAIAPPDLSSDSNPGLASGSEKKPADLASGTAGKVVTPAEQAAFGADTHPAKIAAEADSQVTAPESEAPNAIDFLLEEEEPEAVARKNAKMATPDRAEPPKAVEGPQDKKIEPTLQLAEIMLSMGLDEGASKALLEYIDANPRQAVYHWLKLLGIYRKKGLEEKFTETSLKLRRHFNIQAGEWEHSGNGEPPTLEQFSRVAAQVQKTWSQPNECLSYLRHLLEDNRDGARAGFPQSVAEEILFLIEVIKETDA